MDKIKAFLAGKKTHLLVLVYVLFVLVTGGAPAGSEDAIAGLDPAAIQNALLGLMISTAKAAFDRFSA